MRAIAIENEASTDPRLVELNAPEPGPGEVLVKVQAASINGFDVAVASGMVRGMMEHRFPAVLGRDFAGAVEAVGEGVTGVAVGDRVFGVLATPHVGPGTLAEYTLVPQAVGLAKIPEGVDLHVAGALGLAGAAAHASIAAVAPASGDTVLISGATGGVGSVAIQLARGAGAEVIATAKPGEEEQFVRDLGATHVVDRTGDVAEQVRRIRPDGVHAVVHLAGNGNELANLLAPEGRFASTLGLGPDQLDRKDVKATAVTAMPTAEVLESLAASVARGELRVPIRKTYDLAETTEAIADFTKGTLGKLAIKV